MKAPYVKPEPYYVLIFGSRWWRNKEVIRQVLVLLPKNTVVIHGDNGYNRRGKALWGLPDDLAVRGADKLAGAIARRMGLKVIRCTPDWDTYGLPAGPIRNSYMLKEYPIDQAYGFHNDIINSTGSSDMWRKCLNKHIPVEIIKENP